MSLGSVFFVCVTANKHDCRALVDTRWNLEHVFRLSFAGGLRRTDWEEVTGCKMDANLSPEPPTDRITDVPGGRRAFVVGHAKESAQGGGAEFAQDDRAKAEFEFGDAGGDAVVVGRPRRRRRVRIPFGVSGGYFDAPPTEVKSPPRGHRAELTGLYAASDDERESQGSGGSLGDDDDVVAMEHSAAAKGGLDIDCDSGVGAVNDSMCKEYGDRHVMGGADEDKVSDRKGCVGRKMDGNTEEHVRDVCEKAFDEDDDVPLSVLLGRVAVQDQQIAMEGIDGAMIRHGSYSDDGASSSSSSCWEPGSTLAKKKTEKKTKRSVSVDRVETDGYEEEGCHQLAELNHKKKGRWRKRTETESGSGGADVVVDGLGSSVENELRDMDAIAHRQGLKKRHRPNVGAQDLAEAATAQSSLSLLSPPIPGMRGTGRGRGRPPRKQVPTDQTTISYRNSVADAYPTKSHSSAPDPSLMPPSASESLISPPQSPSRQAWSGRSRRRAAERAAVAVSAVTAIRKRRRRKDECAGGVTAGLGGLGSLATGSIGSIGVRVVVEAGDGSSSSSPTPSAGDKVPGRAADVAERGTDLTNISYEGHTIGNEDFVEQEQKVGYTIEIAGREVKTAIDGALDMAQDVLEGESIGSTIAQNNGETTEEGVNNEGDRHSQLQPLKNLASTVDCHYAKCSTGHFQADSSVNGEAGEVGLVGERREGLGMIEGRDCKENGFSVTNIDGTTMWEVEEVLGRRFNAKTDCVEYLTKWRGCPDPGQNTWEPESNFSCLSRENFARLWEGVELPVDKQEQMLDEKREFGRYSSGSRAIMEAKRVEKSVGDNLSASTDEDTCDEPSDNDQSASEDVAVTEIDKGVSGLDERELKPTRGVSIKTCPLCGRKMKHFGFLKHLHKCEKYYNWKCERCGVHDFQSFAPKLPCRGPNGSSSLCPNCGVKFLIEEKLEKEQSERESNRSSEGEEKEETIEMDKTKSIVYETKENAEVVDNQKVTNEAEMVVFHTLQDDNMQVADMDNEGIMPEEIHTNPYLKELRVYVRVGALDTQFSACDEETDDVMTTNTHYDNDKYDIEQESRLREHFGQNELHAVVEERTIPSEFMRCTEVSQVLAAEDSGTDAGMASSPSSSNTTNAVNSDSLSCTGQRSKRARRSARMLQPDTAQESIRTKWTAVVDKISRTLPSTTLPSSEFSEETSSQVRAEVTMTVAGPSPLTRRSARIESKAATNVLMPDKAESEGDESLGSHKIRKDRGKVGRPRKKSLISEPPASPIAAEEATTSDGWLVADECILLLAALDNPDQMVRYGAGAWMVEDGNEKAIEVHWDKMLGRMGQSSNGQVSMRVSDTPAQSRASLVLSACLASCTNGGCTSTRSVALISAGWRCIPPQKVASAHRRGLSRYGDDILNVCRWLRPEEARQCHISSRTKKDYVSMSVTFNRAWEEHMMELRNGIEKQYMKLTDNNSRIDCVADTDMDCKHEAEVTAGNIIKHKVDENSEFDALPVSAKGMMHQRMKLVVQGDPRPSLHCSWCGPKWHRDGEPPAETGEWIEEPGCRACRFLHARGWQMLHRVYTGRDRVSADRTGWNDFRFTTPDGAILRGVKKFLTSTTRLVARELNDSFRETQNDAKIPEEEEEMFTEEEDKRIDEASSAAVPLPTIMQSLRENLGLAGALNLDKLGVWNTFYGSDSNIALLVLQPLSTG